MDDTELLKATEEIMERFRRCAQLRIGNRISDFVHIGNGLGVIREICGPEQELICVDCINELMEKEPVYVGPAHGDFHPRNILRDSDGGIYIIDLDCFRRQGFQALDVIYFATEYYANKNHTNWYEQLILFAEGKQDFLPGMLPLLEKFCKISDRKWLLLYFLDRVGQDRSYVSSILDMPVREIEKVLDVCMKNLNQGSQ